MSNQLVRTPEDTRVEINDKEDLLNVATVSSNGDEKIGTLITEALQTVGDEGAGRSKKRR